jgi:hypothetical protein
MAALNLYGQRRSARDALGAVDGRAMPKQPASMNSRVAALIALAMLIGAVIGWRARDIWASDRCLDAGGRWIAGVGGCDLPGKVARRDAAD